MMTTQLMHIVYEQSRADKSRARMALSAEVAPMFRSDSKMQTTSDIKTALSGIFHRGYTCDPD